MSRRYSSKSHKNKGSQKVQVSENSLGAAIFAKDPKLAEQLAAKTVNVSDNKAQNRSGPKIMPGDFTTSKRSGARNAPPARRFKKPKNKPVKKEVNEPLNKPLQVRRTIVKEKELNSPNARQSPKASSKMEEHVLLLAEFGKMDRADGIENYSEIGDWSSLNILKDLNQNFISYNQCKGSGTERFYLTVGFDFGTSSSKIVVNAPYGDGRSFAFPVPKYFQMDSHPNLWRSILSHDLDDNTFSLIPKEQSIQIANLKTSLMGKPSKVLATVNGFQLTAEHLCAAYVGLLLRYVKGWVWKNFNDFFGVNNGDVSVIWEVNFGLPAATLDSTPDLKRFELAFNAAWVISEDIKDVSAESIRLAFELAVSRKDALRSITSLRPEVAAEAIGLLRSHLADFGTYVLIDVGASTLDICVFDYLDGDERERQAMFVADVSLLGAESPRWMDELNKNADFKFSEDHLIKSIRTAIGTPVVYTKTRMHMYSEAWTGNLRIILAGGGKDSQTHQQAIERFKSSWLRHTDTKEVTFIQPVLPKNLLTDCGGEQFHRLSVAWGLSLNKGEFVKVHLPSAIKPQLRASLDYTDNFISKDDV